MASGDVRAGKAFVALGTDDSRLRRGLTAALGRVRSFVSAASSIGSGGALFSGLTGALSTSAFVSAIRGFSDAGAELARLQKQTGLSARALSGLARAAADNDVDFGTMRKSLTALQKGIANGGPEVEEAFARIGVGLEQVRRMQPDQVLDLLADGLPKIEDESIRAATALTLLGRSGVEMLPALERGAAGLTASYEAAKRAGEAFDQDTLDAANRLDDALDGLAGSTRGLRNAIGESLTPTIAPLVDALSAAVQGVSAWIQKNPEAVRSAFGLAIGVTALAASVAGLVAATWALTSPVTLTIGLLAGLGGAALAATDALGHTNTGVGDLFNSIRVGGHGLGTWFGSFFAKWEREWDFLVTGVKLAWSYLSTEAQNVGSRIYSKLVWVPRALLEAFRSSVNAISSVLTGFADAWNATLGTITDTIDVKPIGTATVDRWIASLKQEEDEARKNRAARSDEHKSTVRDVVRKSVENQVDINKRVSAMLKADPDDGTNLDFDPERAKKATLKIGSGIVDAVQSTLSGLAVALNGVETPKPPPTPDPIATLRPSSGAGIGQAADAQDAPEAPDAAEKEREKVDVAATFNADIAGRLGIGSTLNDREARAAEKTAANTNGLTDALRAVAAAVRARPAEAEGIIGALKVATLAALQSNAKRTDGTADVLKASLLDAIEVVRADAATRPAPPVFEGPIDTRVPEPTPGPHPLVDALTRELAGFARDRRPVAGAADPAIAPPSVDVARPAVSIAYVPSSLDVAQTRAAIETAQNTDAMRQSLSSLDGRLRGATVADALAEVNNALGKGLESSTRSSASPTTSSDKPSSGLTAFATFGPVLKKMAPEVQRALAAARMKIATSIRLPIAPPVDDATRADDDRRRTLRIGADRPSSSTQGAGAASRTAESGVGNLEPLSLAALGGALAEAVRRAVDDARAAGESFLPRTAFASPLGGDLTTAIESATLGAVEFSRQSRALQPRDPFSRSGDVGDPASGARGGDAAERTARNTEESLRCLRRLLDGFYSGSFGGTFGP